MRCPSLSEIPAPPAGRTGWPWDIESPRMPEFRPDGRPWSRISIVTPSYGQGQFIEETIRSILLQGYPNLEFLIIDGGSKDNTVDVIRKYQQHIDFWVSEKDRGQSHAINKGLARCNGEIFNWINSDDVLLPGALEAVGRGASEHPGTVIAGGTEFFNAEGVFLKTRASGQTLVNFVRFWEAVDFGWAQQSTFVPLADINAVGGVREDLRFCMDYNLMVRLLQRGLTVSYVDRMLAKFRFHEASKTVGESRSFRLERVKMLRSLEGLSVPVSDREWDREQAKRLVDIGLRDLRVGRLAGAARLLGRAIAVSPHGALRELANRAAGKLGRRLGVLSPLSGREA